jgi:hypothetical protein
VRLGHMDRAEYCLQCYPMGCSKLDAACFALDAMLPLLHLLLLGHEVATAWM